jgi:tRNA dimethylallyltransferase
MRLSDDILGRCWFLAGPTACGKTAASLVLAERLGAEIVSLDSMAVYRGMDVGTAKPSADERARVVHHLVDLIASHEEFSLAEYVAAAEAACRSIVARGRVPLFVGGTGLYLRGVLRGVFDGPPADADVRRRLEAEAEESGREALHRRLGAIDPIAAARLPPADLRRVVRALEVFELTGTPLSEHHREGPRAMPVRPAYWVSPPRAWLHERINRRVDAMIADGLVDEVRRLRGAERAMSHTAAQGLGYKEVIDHLEGRCDLPAAIETIRSRTRQFAKRQHTWFRNLVECWAVEITGDETPEGLAERILAQDDARGKSS